MIWLWRTFSSLLCAVAALAASVGGSVELPDSRDPGVRKHKDFSGVVVWLEPLDRSAPAPTPKSATMRQRDKRFLPHVLVIPIGSTVTFPNLDPIFHNAFSNFAGQPFDTGLYPPGSSQAIQFRRDGVVRVFCNIHSTMTAVIVVLKTPYYTETARDGQFRIEHVPPGAYRVHFWHERATEDTLRRMERKIEVSPEGLTLPVLRISESGFLEGPHKNKYGQEYPPETPDHTVYPGVRK
jgi:plastocyanin